ncbi:MAG TPA: hypothetical protein PLN55_01530 [Burkholderiaceae bacterium]|nr:hypothetical protein [Burkholderiaceae bacterium]
MSLRLAVALACGLVLPVALAQTKAPQQVVKPPVAQAWIDVATFAGMGMPAGGGAPGMGAMMGNLFGGGPGARNSFGNTQAMSPGRWVDVTLATSRNPALAEGVQLVPAGTGLAPQLTLLAPPQAKPAVPDDERVIEQDYERPKGKLYLYWGCGDNVRAGQPRVLDMATANPAAYAQFFVARRATQRGAHSAAGRPLWPNERDARMVPANASLVGEHSFTGQGVPEGFKIGIPAPQDLMPPIELKQAQAGGVTTLEWRAVPHARAYFIAAMGAKSMDSANPEMVFWTSSELPETGMGLIDYQTNAAVDRWLKEKVLLEPAVTRCAVPKGIFPEGGGAMLRMIAYGSELNLAHPPRPADPKQAWEPQWAAKVRVKSVANAMLGMDMPAMMGAPADTQTPAQRETPQQPKTEPTLPDAVNILRGILGR